MEEEDDVISDDPLYLQLWLFVSQLQYWILLVFTIVTLPLLSLGLRQLRRLLRRSHYYVFLAGICIANLVSLSTILFELVTNRMFANFKGPNACKAVHFLSNTAACFANWTFLVMFAQRFVILFFPLRHMMQAGVIGLLLDTRRLMAVVLMFSILTQSWSLFLITEQRIKEGNETHVTCERDTEVLDERGYKWVALLEVLSTYLLPFLCTLAVDLGVLVWSQRGTSGFTEAMIPQRGRATSHVVLFRGLSNGNSSGPLHTEHETGLKIQSAESIRSCNKRRHRAIRRCLLMATVQVLINLPYYTLQFIDEFYKLRESPRWYAFYFYADAALYLLYLCQYPIILVHIHFLISDTNKTNKKSPMHMSSRNTSCKKKSSRVLSVE